MSCEDDCVCSEGQWYGLFKAHIPGFVEAYKFDEGGNVSAVLGRQLHGVGRLVVIFPTCWARITRAWHPATPCRASLTTMTLKGIWDWLGFALMSRWISRLDGTEASTSPTALQAIVGRMCRRFTVPPSAKPPVQSVCRAQLELVLFGRVHPCPYLFPSCLPYSYIAKHLKRVKLCTDHTGPL